MRKLIASEPLQQWIEIKYENKPAGKVHIRSTWTPFPPNSSRLQKAKSSAATASGEPVEVFDYQPLLDAKDKEIEARESIIKEKDEEIESTMKLIEDLKDQHKVDIATVKTELAATHQRQMSRLENEQETMEKSYQDTIGELEDKIEAKITAQNDMIKEYNKRLEDAFASPPLNLAIVGALFFILGALGAGFLGV